MLVGVRYSLGIALEYPGVSGNRTNPKELDEANQPLLRQKPFVAAYTDGPSVLLAKDEAWVSYGFSGDVEEASRKKRFNGTFLPRQGTILGIDSLWLKKAVKNAEFPHAFLNTLHDGEVAAGIMNEILYTTPNEGAYPYSDPQIRNHLAVYPAEEVIRRSEFLLEVGGAQKLYEEAWAEIKAT